MDEAHLLAAARYIALNPVAAGLVGRAEEWPWSSVAAHLVGRDDGLVMVAPLLARVPDFAGLIAAPEDAAITARLERAATIGRPLGAPAWIAGLEARLGRSLARRKPGPKPRHPAIGPDTSPAAAK
jgi:putative transposase